MPSQLTELDKIYSDYHDEYDTRDTDGAILSAAAGKLIAWGSTISRALEYELRQLPPAHDRRFGKQYFDIIGRVNKLRDLLLKKDARQRD